MQNKILKNLIIDQNSKLKDIVSFVNKNGYGACFVVDGSKFKAVISDGDLRKLILEGYSLNSNILKFIKNKRNVCMDYQAPDIDILKKLSTKIKIIPLLDKQKRIVNFRTLNNVKKINIYDINLTRNESNYVNDCLNSGWISSVGKYVQLFEKKFSKLFNCKYTLSVTSGTTGLHLALKALNIGKNDEVIVPNLTFAASANAIINSGAVPVFVDINKRTYNMNIDELKKKINKNTKAIMCVHLYGLPCDMDKIKNISKKNNLYLIEDCAEAIGSKYKDEYVSSFGDVSVFSFFGNKTITTGEGGMVVTQNKKIYQKAFILRNQGMSLHKKYWQDDIGFNYRMTNLQAAIGLAQLENFNNIIKKKLKVAKLYECEIKKLKLNIKNKIILPFKDKNLFNTFWLYTIRIKYIDHFIRDKIIKNLNIKGIETRNFFYPFSEMDIYKKYIKKKEKFPTSIMVAKNGICLPSSSNLKYKEIQYIVKSLGEEIDKIKRS